MALSDNCGNSMNSYVRDYVVFDLETTGISPNYDEVIEISAVKVINEEVVDEFSTLVNPGRHIPSGASSVNGIYDRMVADAPSFEPVLKEFIEFIGDYPLVGHNIKSFDMKFIYRDCEKYFEKKPDNPVIDTLYLSRRCNPGLPNHKLTTVADYYGFSTTGAHRALNDCRMNQKVYAKLGEAMQPGNSAKSGLKQCPDCGGILKLRNGRFGEFYGCTNYPGCKYTENV